MVVSGVLSARLSKSAGGLFGVLRSGDIFRANGIFQSINRTRFNSSRATDAQMTHVEKILMDRIKTTGPVSFATYMNLCLSHPTHGYYMNPENAVFGAKGDFVTSPEISQVFGELIAIWLISQWKASGHSKPIRIIELGPGNGTLMADMLRVINQLTVSSCFEHVELVENSVIMQAKQKERLSSFIGQNKLDIRWQDSIQDIPRDSEMYTMIVAHEFFDALPVHLLQKCQDRWREVLIASASDTKSVITDSGLIFSQHSENRPTPHLQRVLASSPSPSANVLGLSSPRFKALPEGSLLEVSSASFKTARTIGELLGPSQPHDEETANGCALIIDYGGDKAFGSSLRAFKQHKIVDVFHRPGECDITANVDFAYLKESLSDLVQTHGPISQGAFLNQMGLMLRVGQLQDKAQDASRIREIGHAAERLVDPTGMGSQYQVMGITSRRNTRSSENSSVYPF